MNVNVCFLQELVSVKSEQKVEEHQLMELQTGEELFHNVTQTSAQLLMMFRKFM